MPYSGRIKPEYTYENKHTRPDLNLPIRNVPASFKQVLRSMYKNLSLSKAQIIRRGTELGVDYSLTWSCYDPAPDGAAAR